MVGSEDVIAELKSNESLRLIGLSLEEEKVVRVFGKKSVKQIFF